MKKASGFAVSLLAVLPAAAQTPIKDCHTVISQPGRYQLVADLNCNQTALSITAGNVTLNLNHYTIIGGNIGINVAADPTVNPPPLKNVTIHGPGLVFGPLYALALWNAVDSEVSQGVFMGGVGINVVNGLRLRLTGNNVGSAIQGIGLFGATSSHVTGNDSSGNTIGIYVTAGSSNTISNNIADGNREDGIRIQGERDMRVYGNIANSNIRYGIRLIGGDFNSSGTVSSNRAFANGLRDLNDENIGCKGHSWQNNTFGSASQACIH